MHLNNVNVIGRMSKTRPKLVYASSGHPTVSFTLEVDEIGKGGEVFTTYLPVELWGQAELAAETLEAGDEIQLSGRLKYKSLVDAKTQVKTSKLVISSWGISQRLPGKTSDPGEGDSTSEVEIVQPEPRGEATTPKARRRRYSKALSKPWHPTGLMSEP